MPVRDHCEMVSKQFLLATSKAEHPNHSNSTSTPPRTMRETLNTRFSKNILPLIPENGTDISSYRSGIQRINTDCVQNTISETADNPVLEEPA